MGWQAQPQPYLEWLAALEPCCLSRGVHGTEIALLSLQIDDPLDAIAVHLFNGEPPRLIAHPASCSCFASSTLCSTHPMSQACSNLGCNRACLPSLQQPQSLLRTPCHLGCHLPLQVHGVSLPLASWLASIRFCSHTAPTCSLAATAPLDASWVAMAACWLPSWCTPAGSLVSTSAGSVGQALCQSLPADYLWCGFVTLGELLRQQVCEHASLQRQSACCKHSLAFVACNEQQGCCLCRPVCFLLGLNCSGQHFSGSLRQACRCPPTQTCQHAKQMSLPCSLGDVHDGPPLVPPQDLWPPACGPCP